MNDEGYENRGSFLPRICSSVVTNAPSKDEIAVLESKTRGQEITKMIKKGKTNKKK